MHNAKELFKLVWNSLSNNFLATNGVKQGGVLSPVLFLFISITCCVYFPRQELDVILEVFL